MVSLRKRTHIQAHPHTHTHTHTPTPHGLAERREEDDFHIGVTLTTSSRVRGPLKAELEGRVRASSNASVGA